MKTSRALSVLLILVSVSLSIATAAFGDGRLETTRAQFLGPTQNAYIDMVKRLDENNQLEGLKYANKFHEENAKSSAYVLDIRDTLETLNIPTLKEKWRDVREAYSKLNIEVSALENDYVGKRDYKDQLSKVKDLFKQYGDALNAAYAEFQKIGKAFRVMCDSCQ